MYTPTTPQTDNLTPARPRRESSRPQGGSGPQGRLGNNAKHLTGLSESEARERKSGEQRDRLTMRMKAAQLVGNDRSAKGIHDLDRIQHCMWTVQDRSQGPRVLYSAATGRNTLHNVQTCKRWACPWCVHERARRAMLELTTAVAGAKREGLETFMVTLTMRHHMGQPLAGLLDDLIKAKADVFAGGWYTRWRSSWGIVGHARYTEITDGGAGWHPHLHIVWFARHGLTESDRESLENQLTARWLSALEKRGRSGLSGIAVDVTAGHSETAAYLAKMGKLPSRPTKPGIEFESAYTPGKKARSDSSFAPLELLAVAAGLGDVARYAAAFTEDDQEAAQALAGRRWLEYFYAIAGRQLVAWSDGLKARWDVEAEADLLEIQEDGETVELGLISDNWIALRSNVPLLVAVFEAGNDPDRIRAMLAEKGIEFTRTMIPIPSVEF